MSELVSIIIPCYNHEQYLDACLESIVQQDYLNIELLICDDCSTDGSFSKLLEWKDKLSNRFERVEIIKNAVNQGVCKTLNRLLRIAKGRYIKSLASDDMLAKDAIGSYVSYANEYPADLYFSNAIIINEEDRYPVDLTIQRKFFYEDIPPSGTEVTKCLCKGNYILGATMFFDASIIEKVGMFDESLSYEDWEYCLRISVNGCIAYLDKTLVFYRVMEGTLSHYDISDKSREKHRKVFFEHQKILSQYSDYATDDEYTSFYNHHLKIAILLDDGELIREIRNLMKSNRIKLESEIVVRIMAYRLRIYKILRKMKHIVQSYK